MFRELTRKKQQLTESECRELLKKEVRGVLALLGDDNYPYAVPINYYYDEAEHRLYFHSGKFGHKIDALKKHCKASFCVYDSGYHKDGHWSLNIKSIILFGKTSVLSDVPEDKIIALCHKFTKDDAYIQNEIKAFAANTLVFVLDIEHMTGKLVNEA